MAPEPATAPIKRGLVPIQKPRRKTGLASMFGQASHSLPGGGAYSVGSLIHLRHVRRRGSGAGSRVGEFVHQFIDSSASRIVPGDHTMSPSLCLAQHIEVPLLRAAKLCCRLIYLVLTGSFRSLVQAANSCAATNET